MLETQISGFIAYCKVSGFKKKSLESLSLRLKQFNGFINQAHAQNVGSILYGHLQQFVADYGQPSIHIKKAMIMPDVLSSLIRCYLADRCEVRGPLFLSRRNKRLSVRSLQALFAAITDAVGIDKHLHAHLFRHTAATALNVVAGTSICQQGIIGTFYWIIGKRDLGSNQ